MQNDSNEEIKNNNNSDFSSSLFHLDKDELKQSSQAMKKNLTSQKKKSFLELALRDDQDYFEPFQNLERSSSNPDVIAINNNTSS